MYIAKYQIKFTSALGEALEAKSGQNYLRKYKAKVAGMQAAVMPPDELICEQTTNRTGQD